MRWLFGHRWQGVNFAVGNQIIIEKEMGLSHRDFFRTIASALGTDSFATLGNGIRLETDDKSLQIELGVESERRIALMVIPRTVVTLTFTNYADEDVKSVVKRFDMRFKRGGG